MDVPKTVAHDGRRQVRALTCSLVAGLAMLVMMPPGLAQAFELHVPVLMYHRIMKPPADATLPQLWVEPRRFRAQMAALRAAGWRTITAEELGRAMRAGRTVGRKRFVISIDDGAVDGYHRAAPILERFGYRATYCVTPGRAHKPWKLSFRLMRLLHEAGHEIANHSLSHADLPAISRSRLRREVRRSRRLIAERVGHAPASFCYPYGHHSTAVRRVVARAGHLLAFTTVHGARQSTSSPMRAPRVRVNGSDSPKQLLAKVRPFRRGGGRLAGPAQSSTALPRLATAPVAARGRVLAAGCPAPGSRPWRVHVLPLLRLNETDGAVPGATLVHADALRHARARSCYAKPHRTRQLRRDVHGAGRRDVSAPDTGARA